jgi:hypothetical protein
MRNRHIFQAKAIRHPTDIIYKWMILLQHLSSAAKTHDEVGMALLVEKLRLVHVADEGLASSPCVRAIFSCLFPVG